MLCGSCRPKAPAGPQPVRDVVRRGPLRLVVAARPRQVWVGDPVAVELRLHTPAGYLARFPAAADVAGLAVRDLRTEPPRPAPDGGLDWRQRFTVETSRSGELEIPPLTVRYARRPAAAGAAAEFTHELVSQALKLTVRSALTTQDSVRRPRDITGTLMPPAAPLSAGKAALLAGAVGGGLAGVWAAYRAFRRRRLRPPPPLLPEVWARAALAELGQGDWFGPGRVREYYYRLTEIVRAYVERKFGLAAPEMTTEEFLRALARDRAALPYEAARLGAFLEACDVVKYAAYRPRPADAEQALRTACAFVDATAAAAQRAGQGRASGARPAPSGGRAA